MRTLHIFSSVAVLSIAALLAACSASEDDSGGSLGTGTGTGSGTGTTTGSTTGSSTGTATGGDGPVINLPGGGGGGTARCQQISFGIIGKPADPTNGGDTTAFTNWLSEASSFPVTRISERTTLTPEFLSQFTIIILESLSDNVKTGPQWQFTQDEMNALATWVQTNGGGLMTMTGYNTDLPDETVGVNQLLSFSGIQYQQSNVLPVAYGERGNECPLADQTEFGVLTCDRCTSTSFPFGNAYHTPGWLEHPITEGLNNVGFFIGHPVVPGDATVIAQSGTVPLGAAKDAGSGRVFVWSDEWITYSSLWASAQVAPPPSQCGDLSVTNLYTTLQFWENALKWVSGCDIVLIEPQ